MMRSFRRVASVPGFLVPVVAAVHASFWTSSERHPGHSPNKSPFAGTAQTCTELGNHGTFFSVELEVGTPPQKFDVVADTGSDDVIIPSCICVDQGSCSKSDRCFTGTNVSDSFTAPKQLNGEVPLISMEFGSGSIVAAVASDVVRIGDASTEMQESLLLMVERELDITGPFEGILGLGRPNSKGATQEVMPNGEPLNVLVARSHSVKQANGDITQHVQYIPGFLQEADIPRFSICFNDGVQQPGVLRLGGPEDPEAMGSIGADHWGLDFRGFSIGSNGTVAEALFCHEEEKKPGMQSPCGMIPDSGTTVMMGPESHLTQLFSSLCDAWPRCKSAYEQDKVSRTPKHEVFQTTLLSCEDWMHDGKGLDEMPSINMHLRGAEGRDSTATLSPWAFVFESELDEAVDSLQLLAGAAPSQHINDLGIRAQTVCLPAFGATEYVTVQNGPVWIIGTPLFYEYVVKYDTEANPPSIALSDMPCGRCRTGEASLVQDEGEAVHMVRSAHGAHHPRRVRGPPRVPRKGIHSGRL